MAKNKKTTEAETAAEEKSQFTFSAAPAELQYD